MTANVQLVYCTCPEAAIASRIAETLVSEGLAACVSQLSGVQSVYRWRGEIERDVEVLLLIKTVDSRFDALAARVRELHPYDVPEIISVPVTRGLPDYLQWVCKCTADDS